MKDSFGIDIEEEIKKDLVPLGGKYGALWFGLISVILSLVILFF